MNDLAKRLLEGDCGPEDTTFTVYGRTFQAKCFNGVDAANAFMAQNKDWGCIGEEGGKVFCARMKDDGTPVRATAP
jgi:hypothetical protein